MSFFEKYINQILSILSKDDLQKNIQVANIL